MTHVDATLVERRELPDARTDRLNYAQVREDPLLEMEVLELTADDTVVAITSGGCTALSLLGTGAGRVVSVDINRTQHHLVELRIAAILRLTDKDLLAFLGATPAPYAQRFAAYRQLREDLSPAARAYWDARPREVEQGVLDAGVTEQFVRQVVRALRILVHPEHRIRQLLGLQSVDAQREFYARAWNTWRWRLAFPVLLNRRIFDGVYTPDYFRHMNEPRFSAHFRERAEHTLTEIPVANNYFLHHMLVGRYPVDAPDGVPPYLSGAGLAAIRARVDRFTLVDGSYTAYLRGCTDASVSAFVISNICEWLPPHAVDEVFTEIARVAAPRARLCFRNFVGWNEVPARWRGVIVEDRVRGERLMRGDRSVVQRRFACCEIRK